MCPYVILFPYKSVAHPMQCFVWPCGPHHALLNALTHILLIVQVQTNFGKTQQVIYHKNINIAK